MYLEKLMGRRYTMDLEVFGESMEYVPCLDLSGGCICVYTTSRGCGYVSTTCEGCGFVVTIHRQVETSLYNPGRADMC
jgi:hypothetical protein